jgi:hypothetical protein
MAPKPGRKRRPAPDLVPDALPGKDEPDVLPDDPAQREEPDVLPDSLPPREKQRPLEGGSFDGRIPACTTGQVTIV